MQKEMQKVMLEPKEKLSNGAEVISFTQFNDEEGVVLCHWNRVTPYVVWRTYRPYESLEWVTESGDYCRTITGAVQAYNRRGGK